MSKLNTLWLYIWTFIGKHKYLFVTTMFVLLIGFIDENSILSRYEHRATISELRSDIRMYTEQYEHDTRQLHELEHNEEAVRKVARERYFMKQANEDVFVFSDTTITDSI